MTTPRPLDPSCTASRRRFLQTTGLGLAAAIAGRGMTAVAAEGKKKKEEPAPAPPPKARKLNLGLASYSTRKFDLDKTIAIAQRAGLQWLCLKDMHLPLTSTNEEIQAAAAKVKAAGLILYGGGVISLRKPEEVDRAFTYAKTAGMQRIVIMAVPELLPVVNEKVQQFDIQVAIHNHGPGDKVWPTPQSAYEKIKTLDKRVGLCVDIGHTVRIGENLVETIRQVADRVLDVHIKDVTEASPRGQCIQLGRGVIDIPAFLKVMVEIGYKNVLSFEYEVEADDPATGIAESAGYARGVIDVI